MAADTLHDEDIVAWAEQQAKTLRALACKRPDLSNLLDWNNIAEEIEALGRAETRLFTGPLRQFLVHVAKALSSPQSRALAHWRREAVEFHDDALEAFLPSMRRKVDLDALWRSALKRASAALAEHGEVIAPDLSEACPFSLDELLEEGLTFDRAVELAARGRRRPAL